MPLLTYWIWTDHTQIKKIESLLINNIVQNVTQQWIAMLVTLMVTEFSCIFSGQEEVIFFVLNLTPYATRSRRDNKKVKETSCLILICQSQGLANYHKNTYMLFCHFISILARKVASIFVIYSNLISWIQMLCGRRRNVLHSATESWFLHTLNLSFMFWCSGVSQSVMKN